MKSFNFQWKSETLNKTEQIVPVEKPILNPVTEILEATQDLSQLPDPKPNLISEPILPKPEPVIQKQPKIKSHELCVCYPAKVNVILNKLRDDVDIQKTFENRIELRIKILELEDLFVRFYCDSLIPIYSLVCVYPQRIRRWWIVDFVENDEYLAVPSNINMKKI